MVLAIQTHFLRGGIQDAQSLFRDEGASLDDVLDLHRIQSKLPQSVRKRMPGFDKDDFSGLGLGDRFFEALCLIWISTAQRLHINPTHLKTGHFPRRVSSMRSLFLLSLLMVFPLRADNLVELKARIAKMKSSEPLKASLSRQNRIQIGTDKQSSVTQGNASVWIEENAQGLKFTWGRALLQKAASESLSKSESTDKSTPTNDAISSIKPGDVESYFNNADNLLKDMERGKFQGEQSANLSGKPMRLLTFSIEPTAEEKKMCNKEFSATLSIWIDATGLPAAKRLRVVGKGRLLAFFSYEGEYDDTYYFAYIGNRLVVTNHTHDEKIAGGNQPNRLSKQTTTIHYVN